MGNHPLELFKNAACLKTGDTFSQRVQKPKEVLRPLSARQGTWTLWVDGQKISELSRHALVGLCNWLWNFTTFIVFVQYGLCFEGKNGWCVFCRSWLCFSVRVPGYMAPDLSYLVGSPKF